MDCTMLLEDVLVNIVLRTIAVNFRGVFLCEETILKLWFLIHTSKSMNVSIFDTMLHYRMRERTKICIALLHQT